VLIVPNYKNQHYLPCCYLKSFSIDEKPSKNSPIWRSDKDRSIVVPVSSQWAEDYHNSKENSEETEKMFQAMENEYVRCLDKIVRGEKNTVKDHFFLFLMIMDLHLRSVRYKNKTPHENIVAYRIRVQAFYKALAGNLDSDQVSQEQAAESMENFWRVRLFDVPLNEILVTSDSPSLWFTIDESQNLDFAVLPLTPKILAVAFDTRKVSTIGSQLTREDVEYLNRNQCLHGHSCIFTSQEPSEEEKASLAKYLQGRPPLDVSVDEESWGIYFISLSGRDSFSFLKRNRIH